MFADRRNLVLALVVAGVIVIVTAVLVLRPAADPPTAAGEPSGGAGGTSTTTSTTGSTQVPNADPTTVPDGSPGPAEAPGAEAGPTTVSIPEPDVDAALVNDPEPPIELPATVRVSSTTALTDGQTIEVNVVPTSGSEVYGVEARLCRAGAQVQFDADMRPTQTGNCIADPLSDGSDAHVVVAGEPPYQSVDLTFRAGVGTSSYTTQDGDPATITCGPGSPCVLALKIQVPNGFGFRTYDVTFA